MTRMQDRTGARRRRSVRYYAKRGVLAAMLATMSVTLQGCAILGFLANVISFVAPLLGPVTNMVTGIIGASAQANAQQQQIQPGAGQVVQPAPAVAAPQGPNGARQLPNQPLPGTPQAAIAAAQAQAGQAANPADQNKTTK